MRWSLVLLAATLLALPAAGCFDQATGGGPEPVTNTFVISALWIDPPDGDRAVGFDLDGVVSTGDGTGCVERFADFRDPDDASRDGIDNQLAAVVETLAAVSPECPGELTGADCVAHHMTSGITEHETLWLIEIAGIHSYRDDDVEVSLYRATFTAPPELIDGRLAPGQVFDGELVARDRGARIVAGRLEAALDARIPFELSLGEMPMPLPLDRARLSVPVTSPLGLSRGVLGGAVPLVEITPCPPTGCGEPGGAVTDLDPDEGDPTRCESLSAALTFDAVRADRMAP